MADKTWTGTTSSDWNDPTNWNPPGVPGAGQTIAIGATAPYSPIVGISANYASIYGDVANDGVISIGSATSTIQSLLSFDGSVTLSGSGRLDLIANNTSTLTSEISSFTPGSTLDNQDTISGSGLIISGANLSVVNDATGVIDANEVGALQIEYYNVAGVSFANDGLLEATNTTSGNGGLVLFGDTIDQTGNHDGGKIEAIGPNATVIVESTTIEGGELTTSDGGQIEILDPSNVFDGTKAPLTITADCAIKIDLNTLTLASTTGGQGGVIDNSGTIALEGASSGVSNLIVGTVTGGSVTLQGGGQVTFNDSIYNQLLSGANNTTLNNVDNTISGAGIIAASYDQATASNNAFAIINGSAGVIEASYADQALRVQSVNLTNNGTLRAENGATLTLFSSLANLVADPNHAGGAVLTGGAYDVIDPTGSGASTIAIDSNSVAPITTLAATVDLAGATSMLTTAGVGLSNSLLDIASTGALDLYYGSNSQSQQVFNDSANPLEVAGYVSLNSAALEASSITIDSNAELYAYGDYNGPSPVNAEATAANGIVNNGLIVADGGVLGGQERVILNGDISGSGAGAISITGDSILELTGAAAGQTIAFANSQSTDGETLRIDTANVNVSTGSFQSEISGLKAGNLAAKTGDFIDLNSIAYDSGGTVSLTSNNVLTITENSQTYTLQLGTTFSGEYFHLASDGGVGAPGSAAGTLVYADTSPCYCLGTLILTERGEVAVETLSVGDVVVTARGERRRIEWIGHRELDLRKHLFPLEVWPVRVRKDAFGESLPRRDLWLSPQHAVFVDGVLIPIIHLANGATIVQERVDHITYFHVELDSHDVILAENLPAESFLDCGSRSGFANCQEFVELHPIFAPKTWDDACAPLREDGPEVEEIRRRLLERAASLGFRQSWDPQLRIVADGEEIWPDFDEAGDYVFALSRDARDIRLVSRTSRPVDGGGEDKRHLGVAVGAIEIDGRVQKLSALGQGWLPLEGEAGAEWRWTDGCAALPVGSPGKIKVKVVGGSLYWSDATRRAWASGFPTFESGAR